MLKERIPTRVRNHLSVMRRGLKSLTDSALRRSSRRLSRLKGAYSGRLVFIMGNGPSLNETPLELLRDEMVWGFNRCHLLFDQIEWRPAFYAAVDTRVVPDISEEIEELACELDETIFFLPARFYENDVLADRPNVVWFNQVGMDHDRTPEGYFSTRADRFVRAPYTVTLTALQLSVYMGFDPIYLVGCDTSYEIPDEVEAEGEVYDRGRDEEVEGFEITSQRDNDPNHFDPSYFGAGSEWHAPNVEGMKFGYRMAKQVCDELGVTVKNATEGGELEVFPRVELQDIVD